MIHFTVRACSLVLLVGGLSLACQTRRPPGLTPITGTASGGSTSGSPADGSSSEDTGVVLLDIGQPDIPPLECASVEQSTMTMELPSDVIIVVDPELPPEIRYQDAYAALQNLQPQLYSGDPDSFRTRVILVAGPPPVCPPPPGIQLDDNPCCGEWTCWMGVEYEPLPVEWAEDFFDLRHDIDPDTMLTDLLALSDQWRPLLREESWKHVWLFTSRSADTMTSGPEFAAAFSGLGASFANFAFHVRSSGAYVDDDYVQLAQETEGVYFPRETEGGGSYSDFVVPIQELIKSSNPLSCAYEIPDPPAGHSFDRNQVNVEYDIGAGPTTLGYVESTDDCAQFGQGWYYDDVADPHEIIFCPYTCGLFKEQELASVEIEFGCATVPAG